MRFDEPVPTKHAATDSEGKVRPQAGREGGPSFVWLGVVRAHMVLFCRVYSLGPPLGRPWSRFPKLLHHLNLVMLSNALPITAVFFE